MRDAELAPNAAGYPRGVALLVSDTLTSAHSAKQRAQAPALRAAAQKLGGAELDFLFIDGDHSYAGVKQDFEKYSGYVKRGGLIAFHDIRPQAPVHLLVVPKAHIATLYDAQAGHQGALGKMLTVAGRLAREAGAADGFRTIINNGRVGHQEVYHVHMHVLGGPEPLGPMLFRRK